CVAPARCYTPAATRQGPRREVRPGCLLLCRQGAMVATFWLLGCVLAPAQAAMPRPAAVRGADCVLVPRLARSQGLYCRGTFTEEDTGLQVQFLRASRIETRVFVLDTPPRGADLAVLTTLQSRAPRSTPNVRIEAGASASRLERLGLDLQGKLSAGP